MSTLVQILVILATAALAFTAIRVANSEWRQLLRKQIAIDDLYAARQRLEIEPFRIAAHFDRLQKVSHEIARGREAAKAKEEPTVLWLILDGLRLNPDGTTEWIRKEEPKKRAAQVSYTDPPYSSDCVNLATQYQQKLDELSRRYRELQYQASYQEQMNSLRQQVNTMYVTPAEYQHMKMDCGFLAPGLADNYQAYYYGRPVQVIPTGSLKDTTFTVS